MADMSTDPLFVKDSGQYYFYHSDHLGTPQKLTAVNGAVVWSAMYSSFGDAQVLPSSTVESNFRFPGQYYDQETGMHYNLHRYYDPSTGRYLRADPIGLNGGINLFSYVQSNAINWIDPLGLYDTTVNAWCKRYPKSCEELVKDGTLPPQTRMVPPPALPRRSDIPKDDSYDEPADEPFDDSCDEDDDHCREHYDRCLMTSLADKSGGRPGQTRCGFCKEVCDREGAWPIGGAPTTRGNRRCDYWNFPIAK